MALSSEKKEKDFLGVYIELLKLKHEAPYYGYRIGETICRKLICEKKKQKQRNTLIEFHTYHFWLIK